MPTRTAPVQASCVYRACDILGQRAARGAPGSANVPPPRQCGPQVQVPWHHGGHGAVDVVGPVALPGRTSGRGDKECTQIGENGLSAPFFAICVHCCAVSCAASCDASCVGWHKDSRVPQPPWRAGGAPSVVASPLVGKTDSARVVPPLGWHLRRDSNPCKLPRCRLYSPQKESAHGIQGGHLRGASLRQGCVLVA